VIGVGASIVLASRMSMREAVTMGVLVAAASAQWLVVRRKASTAPSY
jgi:hypothetical protein